MSKGCRNLRQCVCVKTYQDTFHLFHSALVINQIRTDISETLVIQNMALFKPVSYFKRQISAPLRVRSWTGSRWRYVMSVWNRTSTHVAFMGLFIAVAWFVHSREWRRILLLARAWLSKLCCCTWFSTYHTSIILKKILIFVSIKRRKCPSSCYLTQHLD